MDNGRRRFLAASAGGFAGFALQNNLPLLFAQERTLPRTAGAMIVLWMDGGPSQIDTFDPRPGRPTAGEFKAIETSVPGLRFSEHLPRTARLAHHLAVVRSVTSDEQDHVRGAYLMHTGYKQSGMVVHPALGSIVSCEKGGTEGLPGYVSIKNSLAFQLGREPGPGFLGPQHAPFGIGDAQRPDQTLRALDDSVRGRLELLEDLNREFHEERSGENLDRRKTFLKLARELKDSPFARALDLRDEDPETLRHYLGGNDAARSQFGYGCLVARRLVEAGVKFVEVNLGGWDTHADNFRQTAGLCGMLDPALSTLLCDLDRRGLLQETVVVWMGEFGRTPDVNGGAGRDHWPNGFTAVLAGGGVGGGRVIGELDADGKKITRDPVRIPDLFATFCTLLGIDPAKRFLSHSTGTARITDRGVPVRALYE